MPEARYAAVCGADALSRRRAGTYKGLSIAEAVALRGAATTTVLERSDVVVTDDIPKGWQGL